MFIQSYIFPLKRWSSCFSKGDSAGVSEGGGVFLVNAIQRLSGLKIGIPPTQGIWNGLASVAEISRNQMSLSRRNASSFPSGLQRGADAFESALVSLLAGIDPSDDLHQISV